MKELEGHAAVPQNLVQGRDQDLAERTVGRVEERALVGEEQAKQGAGPGSCADASLTLRPIRFGLIAEDVVVEAAHNRRSEGERRCPISAHPVEPFLAVKNIEALPQGAAVQDSEEERQSEVDENGGLELASGGAR